MGCGSSTAAAKYTPADPPQKQAGRDEKQSAPAAPAGEPAANINRAHAHRRTRPAKKTRARTLHAHHPAALLRAVRYSTLPPPRASLAAFADFLSGGIEEEEEAPAPAAARPRAGATAAKAPPAGPQAAEAAPPAPAEAHAGPVEAAALVEVEYILAAYDHHDGRPEEAGVRVRVRVGAFLVPVEVEPPLAPGEGE